MLQKLLTTPKSHALAVVRVALGVVVFAHGAQKALGWFGGSGPSGTIGFFDQALGVPAALTVLVIAAEFLGGLGLIIGALGRVAAAGVIAVMLGAVALVHFQNGFFMNWSGQQAGQGFEFHFLAIAMAAAVMLRGSGAFSVDRAVVRSEAPRPER
jgi:putative oxidoreductase